MESWSNGAQRFSLKASLSTFWDAPDELGICTASHPSLRGFCFSQWKSMLCNVIGAAAREHRRVAWGHGAGRAAQ